MTTEPAGDRLLPESPFTNLSFLIGGLGAILLLLSVAFPSSLLAYGPFQIIELPSLGGTDDFGKSINIHGHVVGDSRGNESYTSYWEDGGFTLLPFAWATPESVNDLGEITGDICNPDLDPKECYPFYFDEEAGAVNLARDVLLGWINGYGLKINNRGEILGEVSRSKSGDPEALFFTSPRTGNVLIPPLGDGTGRVHNPGDLNNLGQATGAFQLTQFGSHNAFLWSLDTGTRQLDGVGGNTAGRRINDHGQVLYHFVDSLYLWEAGSSTLVGHVDSYGGTALTNGGYVLTESPIGYWIWHEEEGYGYLSDLLPPHEYEWISPWDMNDRLQIAGYAASAWDPETRSRSYRAILLQPLGYAFPDVEANGSDLPRELVRGEPLSLTIELNPYQRAGEMAEWYVTVEKSAGTFTYDFATGEWTEGIRPSKVAPLELMVPTEILARSDLPPGTYTYTFAVDTTLDGLREESPFNDSVTAVVKRNGNDMLVDFGAPYGVWAWRNNDQAGWVPLSGLDAEIVAVGDLDGSGVDDALFDFGPDYGLWALFDNDPARWTHLSGLDVELIAVGDLDGSGADDALFDFGPDYGLWALFDGDAGQWMPVTGLSPELMAVTDLNGSGPDDILCDFGLDYGVWALYDNDPATWAPVTGLSPETMTVGNFDDLDGDDVLFDFGLPHGLWLWHNNDAVDWEHISSVSPGVIAAGDFDGIAGDDLLIDFGPGSGLWAWRPSRWTGQWAFLTDLSPERIATGDLDGDGRDDALIDYGASLGLWAWYNNGPAGWAQITTLSSEGAACGNVDGQ